MGISPAMEVSASQIPTLFSERVVGSGWRVEPASVAPTSAATPIPVARTGHIHLVQLWRCAAPVPTTSCSRLSQLRAWGVDDPIALRRVP